MDEEELLEILNLDTDFETKNNTIEEINNRLDKIQKNRNEAIKIIREYQAKNGTPTDDEADEHFLKEEMGLDITLEEFNKMRRLKNARK